MMRRRRFEALVAEALRSLPPELRRMMSNVVITVEDWPSIDDLTAAGGPAGETLYGLYVGVPLTERASDYTMTLPDRIIIFQGPHEATRPSYRELVHEVQTTVVHEIAHHFGLSDEQLTRLGWG